MTIGHKLIGSWTGDFVWEKSWNGSDDPRNHHNENAYTMTLRSRDRRKSHYSGDPARMCIDGYGYNINGESYNRYKPFTSNDQLNLLNKLATKVKGFNFNLGVFTAQGGQAATQTIATLTAFGKAAIALKHGNVTEALSQVGLLPGQRGVGVRDVRPALNSIGLIHKEPVRMSKRRRKSIKRKVETKLTTGDVSGAWLAMQYGWLPTLGDLYDAWDAYHKLSDKPRVGSVVVKRTNKLSYDGSSLPARWKMPGISYCNRRIKHLIKENPSSAQTLGLYDPLSIGWEILPWSFVIDWFFPIGSYLEARQAIPSLSGTSVSSNFIRSKCKLTWVNTSGGIAKAKYCSDSFPYESSWVSMTRTVGSLSVPSPNFVPVPDAMSPKRILNAIALAHQRFK